MEHLPNYIYIVFLLSTAFTLLMFYKASGFSKTVIIVASIWLFAQAAIALTGFYTITRGLPPRFALVLMPPVVFIIVQFLTKRGRAFIDSLDVKTLTLINTVRITVELTLYWLFVHKAVPQIMTFEGHNFDILCGLTAPIIYYFGFVKKVFGKKVLIAWNIACLLLLTNIVVTAVLSIPLPFQQFGFEQPNIALFYFPFVWLPGFIVPVALFGHLVSLRLLIRGEAKI